MDSYATFPLSLWALVHHTSRALSSLTKDVLRDTLRLHIALRVVYNGLKVDILLESFSISL